MVVAWAKLARIWAGPQRPGRGLGPWQMDTAPCGRGLSGSGRGLHTVSFISHSVHECQIILPTIFHPFSPLSHFTSSLSLGLIFFFLSIFMTVFCLHMYFFLYILVMFL